MKNKITIRRSGCFLPTFALVVIFLLVSALLWLSTVGLPQAATDYLTAKVKEETGLTLKVEKIRLAPLNGLGIKAEKVSLYEPGLPALHFPKLGVSFDWDDVVAGRFDLPHIRIRDGVIAIAVGETTDELLSLSKLDLNAEIRCPQGTNQLHLNGACNLQGIDLKATAIFPLPKTEENQTQESTPLDIKAAIADAKEEIRGIMPELQQVYTEMDRQHWATPPTVVLAYSEEGPQPIAHVAAQLPSYEWQDIRFRDAHLFVEKNGSHINLKRLAFRTSAPDTVFETKAEYDLENRQGAFDILSSASLVELAQKFLQEAAPAWLQMIHHEPGVTPRIRLKGDVRLAENYEPEHLRIEGDLEQKGFTVNDSVVKSVSAGFFYEDGNLNLDGLNLELPDDGRLALTAQLVKGQGEVNLLLNSDIDYLLHLANHFANVTLPKGVELQGKTAAELQLNLTTPPFVPGKTAWQTMIPTLTDIQFSLNADHVAAEGATAEKPSLRLAAKGMEIPCDKLPECSVGQLLLNATAESVTYDKAVVTRPVIQMGGRDISLTPAAETLNVTVESATGELSADQAVYDDAAVQRLVLTAEAPYGWSSAKPVLQQLGGLHLHLDSNAFAVGDDFRGDRLTTDAAVDAGSQAADIKLATDLNGQELTLHLPCTLTEDSVTLNDVELTCPLAEFEPLLQRFVGEDYSAVAKHLRLPKEIRLNVLAGGYNFAKNRLTDTTLTLTIPELVRTPNAVPAMRGKEVAVGLNTVLNLRQDENGDILYSGNLHVTHKSGQLDAEVDGNIASYVHVTNGRNTIFADAIDLLIDDADAHAIIRDFRFTPGKSKILADDIDTKVSYDNGICVEVTCDADIIDTEYLLNAYTEQESNGTVREVYQEGITADTFTLFQHAHCGVEVKVLLDRKDKNGKPIPDVQTIDLTDVELTSNNSRWFTQNNISGAGLKTTTTIKGESILFNIENNTLTLSGLKGDGYPAYTIGTFYLPLRDYLSGILLTAPAQLETKEVVVPIATHCDVPMSGTIRVRIPNGGRYDLQGTIIPVEQFSGFVTLFDDHVYLDKLNAATWGGVLNGQLSIGFNDKLPAFDGYFVARAMDLRRIAKAFNSDFKPAVCAGEFRFRAKNAELTSLEGYGAARVNDGDLMAIPLFSPVAYVITHLPEFLAEKATYGVQRVTGLNVGQESTTPEKEEEKSWWQRVTGVFTHPVRTATSAVNYSADAAASQANNVQDAAAAYVPFANYVATYDLQDASAFFTLRNGFLYSDDVKASGSNLKVKLDMTLNLTDMTINATLHPSFNSLVDIAARPFTVLSKYMLDIKVSGPLRDLSWSVHMNNSEAIKKQMKNDVERLKKGAKGIGNAVGM